jgi:predicted transcriptional regulator
VLDSWQVTVTRDAVKRDSARRMAIGMLDMATREGRALVGLSARSAAELINMSRGTAGRALQELQALGVIEMAGEPTPRQAARYRLMHASLWACAAPGTVSPSPWGGVRQLTVPATAAPAMEFACDLRADAWGTKGLGEAGRLLYLELTAANQRDTEATVDELAASLCRSPRTVYTHLARLRTVGLARPLSHGGWVAEYKDPAAVAFDLGVAGLGAAREAQHRRERRDHSVRQVMNRLLNGEVPTGRPDGSRRSPEENRSQNRRIRIPMTITASKTALIQVAPIHLPDLVIDICQRELN